MLPMMITPSPSGFSSWYTDGISSSFGSYYDSYRVEGSVSKGVKFYLTFIMLLGNIEQNKNM